MSWDYGWEKIFKKREWGTYPAEELVRFIKSSPKTKGKKILEVGCGVGANLWFLHDQGMKVYGIDGSKTAIKKAKKLIKSKKAKAKLKVGDIISLPYKDNFFDFIIDIECLYSNSEQNTKIILEEIYRILKPQGFLFSKSFGKKCSHIDYNKKYMREKSTFLNKGKNVFKKDYKIIRFMDILDIKRIYKFFKISKIDEIIRSVNNRKKIIHEWIIICKK